MPLVGRLDELPWVGAVAPYRRRDDRAPNGAHAALVRLGALALDAFPATVLPNPLIHELDAPGHGRRPRPAVGRGTRRRHLHGHLLREVPGCREDRRPWRMRHCPDAYRLASIAR
jgi:hypothetical protein